MLLEFFKLFWANYSEDIYRFQLSPVHDQRSAAGIFQTFLATYSEDSF